MARKTVKKKTTSARKKTTAAKKTFVKLSETAMKELAGKYSRSRDKRKARGVLLKKYGKTQTARISAMAKAMEKSATKTTAKTTSARKTTVTRKKTAARKTTSTPKATSAKTTSAPKATSAKTTTKKKSKGRIAQGNKLNKLMTARAKAEWSKRGNALVSAYKSSSYAKSPNRKNWNEWVKKCGNVILAGMVKQAATSTAK